MLIWRAGWTRWRKNATTNRGYLVVAVYKESDAAKPGHIAIVRPIAKSDAKIREEGPQVIQAGSDNHASTSLKEGFTHHPGAFREGQIRYFVHALPAKAGVSGKKTVKSTLDSTVSIA
jgi:hypothetical protein